MNTESKMYSNTIQSIKRTIQTDNTDQLVIVYTEIFLFEIKHGIMGKI